MAWLPVGWAGLFILHIVRTRTAIQIIGRRLCCRCFDGCHRAVLRFSQGGLALRVEDADELPAQEPHDEAERICIQEGLEAIRAGRVRDFDEFDREFRLRNEIPADAKNVMP